MLKLKDKNKAHCFLLAAAIGSGGHWTAKDEAELRQKIRDGHEDVMLELSRMAKQLRADQQQQSNTIGTQVAEDSLKSIENDTWRDRSLSGHNRGSSHCDCCYCEVFGHGTGSTGGLFGPNRIDAHYPQMRDRLRLKLKQKKVAFKLFFSGPNFYGFSKHISYI